MKLNQRYVKVFALYFVSIVTANIVVKNNNLIKTLIQTLAGYTVFAEWDSNDIFAKFISSSHHNMH